MEFKFSVLDITKSVALIAIVAFVWFNGYNLIDSIRGRGSSEIPDEVITILKANQVIVENQRADNQQFRTLLKSLMEDRDSQSAQLLEYVNKINEEKDAKIDEIANVVATLTRTVDKIERASDVVKTPTKTGDAEEDERRDKLTYEMKKIYSVDAEGNEFPIAWAMYFPNQDPDKRWKTGTYDLEFHETIIESQQKSGAFDRAIELHIENNKLAETKDKEFSLELTNVEWEKYELKEKYFNWFNPRIGLGINLTNEIAAPELNLSIMSYGKTDIDMDWKFLTFGLGVSNDEGGDLLVTGSFEPFSWNVGKALPLVKNIFIGPEVLYSSDLSLSYGVKVTIPF